MEPDERREVAKHYHIFLLAAYIHSGVSLSLSRERYPFNDPWDSCCIGAVFANKEEWRAKTKAQKAAQGLIDTWNDYLSGNVWGYVVKDKSGAHVHSFSGYYGDYINLRENDMLSEARADIDADIQRTVRRHAERLKAYIRNRVPFQKRVPCPAL